MLVSEYRYFVAGINEASLLRSARDAYPGPVSPCWFAVNQCGTSSQCATACKDVVKKTKCQNLAAGEDLPSTMFASYVFISLSLLIRCPNDVDMTTVEFLYNTCGILVVCVPLPANMCIFYNHGESTYCRRRKCLSFTAFLRYNISIYLLIEWDSMPTRCC